MVAPPLSTFYAVINELAEPIYYTQPDGRLGSPPDFAGLNRRRLALAVGSRLNEEEPSIGDGDGLRLHFRPLLLQTLGRDGDCGAELLREKRDAIFFQHPTQVEQLGIDDALRFLMPGVLDK